MYFGRCSAGSGVRSVSAASIRSPEAQGANQVSELQGLAAAAQPLKHPSIQHAQLIKALAEGGHRAEARVELEAASQLAGGRADVHESLAFLAFGLGAHEIARDMYARVTESRPRDATAWFNLATAERTVGRLAHAERACDFSLQIDTNQPEVALLRSLVRTQRSEANHTDELRRWLAAASDVRTAILLNYALGKELDDIGEYDEAFRCFATGAGHRRRNLAYDVEQDVWKLRRIRETFDAERLYRAPPLQRAEFGFIVGLPRSGTTMIERVLTGNARVATNGETDNLLHALMGGAPPAAQDVFQRIAEADPAIVQADYGRRAADPTVRPLVLEKLPSNVLYAGAIRLTLPSARTIVVTRAPADNCFAMFSTLFGAGYPFSYDLMDLARYFIAYRELVAHWVKILPDQILKISYERFVEAPVTMGPRMAAHMGVEWTDAMTKIENNLSPSATASAAQIRQPIYTSSAGRSHNYAKYLGPLIATLEAAGIDPYGSD